MTIIKRESAAMGRNHVCDAYAAPCDDPESQLDLSNGAKDRENFSRGGIAAENVLIDVCVLPTLNCKRVVMVQPGG